MQHQIVSREDWLNARTALLAKEKELTKLRDRLSAELRALPWVKIDKTYLFDAPSGKVTLSDLFDGRSQLIIKHFMLAPGQKEGCVGCSFESDHAEAALVHLLNHDVSYVAVARAPLAEIEAFKARMGWTFPWVSSFGSDFNYDFNVSFTPEQVANGTAFYNYRAGPVPLEDLSGLSVFYNDADGSIYHTYSSFGRGGEERLGTYIYLDMTPNGRNENGPSHTLTDWVRHHDRYGAPGHVNGVGRWVAAEGSGGCCHETAAQ
ncbi:MAG: thioredoxin family protein [Dongiaceae bacterium]